MTFKSDKAEEIKWFKKSFLNSEMYLYRNICTEINKKISKGAIFFLPWVWPNLEYDNSNVQYIKHYISITII